MTNTQVIYIKYYIFDIIGLILIEIDLYQIFQQNLSYMLCGATIYASDTPTHKIPNPTQFFLRNVTNTQHIP